MSLVGKVFEAGWIRKFAPRLLGRKGPTSLVGANGNRTSEGRFMRNKYQPKK